MDWTNLLSNTLWIAALALVLAVVGYTRWRAKNAGIAVRTAIQNVGTQFGLYLAGLLFSLGLAISARSGGCV